MARVRIPPAALKAFCERNGIRRLAFFGSVLRDDFRSDSDVDVLVEFRPGAPIGLFEMARLEAELSDMLGRKADLRTPAEISRYFRSAVLQEAEVQFEV